ncbi:hypothetical protein BJX70DRAFT_400104 [Aspergillus crustosus]
MDEFDELTDTITGETSSSIGGNGPQQAELLNGERTTWTFKWHSYKLLDFISSTLQKVLFSAHLPTDLQQKHSITPDIMWSMVIVLIGKRLEQIYSTPIPPKHTRFKWTCSHCNRTFTETVREPAINAAKDWVREMHEAQNDGSHQPFSAGPLSGIITLTQPPSTRPVDPLDHKYVLLAVTKRKLKRRLIHLALENTATDKYLYENLRTAYEKARRPWKWIRLRSLSHIEWKQLYIFHSNKIALSPQPDEDWPQCGRPTCATTCSRALDYEYVLCPARIDPPIPCEALMHFLENPDHAGSKLLHRDAMPKRAGYLALGPDQHLQGWGLLFAETVAWGKVAVIEGVIAVASLGFAGVWMGIGMGRDE